jgi:hypothetical protein
MNRQAKFTVPSGVIARQLSGEAVILDVESGTYFGLNAVGTRIWELIEAGKTLDQVCSKLLDEFEVAPEQLEGDVSALAGELQQRRLIEPA